MMPESVHTGRAAEVRKMRQATLEKRLPAHAEPLHELQPQLRMLPTAAWINPPTMEKKAAGITRFRLWPIQPDVSNPSTRSAREAARR
jgi:hypothetical protein